MRTPSATRAFMKLARERFEQGQTANHDQRVRELADLAFYNLDQWPADILAARKGQGSQGGMPPIPERPCLTIDQTRPAVNSFVNQIRSSEIGGALKDRGVAK